MQMDTKSILRLRDALLERSGLQGLQEGDQRLDETSPEMRALVARVGPMGEALYLMMVIDGQIEPKERQSLKRAIQILTADGLPDPSVDRLFAGYEERVRMQGPENRMTQVGAQLCADKEDAEATLMLAAAIALADGNVAISESKMLEGLSEWLGFSARQAQSILDR
ncbi:TerB family tellurite resistance protein [Myxococcota bacterium]|nr:TerB family tellurite resistance protein [Myxococcota bacterium]